MSEALTTEQARALGAPTRQAILALLSEASEPVPVAELAERLGLNHNAIRKHLAQLVGAALVVEEREDRTTPGRPRLLYRLPPPAPTAADRYERLAVLLATALGSGDDPATIGRAASAADTVPVGGPAVEALAAHLATEGFDPVVRRQGRRTDIVLQSCPFAGAATANPSAVCRLHLGLAQGAADAIGGVRVDGLTAKDPQRAGCRVAVTELDADRP